MSLLTFCKSASTVRNLHPLKTTRNATQKPARSAVRVSAGLFDAFTSKTAVVKVAPKAQQTVDELLELTVESRPGITYGKEDVEELVRELEGLCMRAPAKSPLLSGVWEVIYKTSPDGLGNPLLRNPLGQAALKDQTYYQVLDTDGELRNVIQYKTLGVVPGEVQQGGAWEVTGPNTIKFVFKTAERELEVVYLDSQLRITKLVKDDGEDTYIVFRRVEESESEEESEEEVVYEEEDESPKKGGLFGGLLGPKPVEGLATRAERSVQRQAGSQSTRTMQIGIGRGTQKVAQGTQGTKKVAQATQSSRGRGTTSTKFDPAAAAEARKAEAERRRREAEEAAERRKQEAEARKQEAALVAQRRKEEAEAKRIAALEAAEAKKREAEEARQRQLEIREFIAELRDEAKDAQTKSRTATAEFKAFEKQAIAALRDSSKAVALIESAEERSNAVEEQLQAAKEQQSEAAQALKAAQQELREAEKAFVSVLRK